MRAAEAVILALVCLHGLAAQTPKELNRQGLEFFRQGKYTQSEQAYRNALAAHRSAPVRDVNGYAAAMNNLAASLKTNGRIVEAQQALTEVVSLDSQIQGEDRIVTHALVNLALIHQEHGEHQHSLRLLKRALERNPAPSEDRAGILHNFGAAYLHMGQSSRARKFFEESLQMHTEIGAVQNTPATLAFLALLAAEAKEESRAFVLLDRALNLRREIHGPIHPAVALSLSNMGELYRKTGRYREAGAAFEESLEILRKSVGSGHPYTALVLYEYAESHRLQGRHAEGFSLYRQTIQILEGTFGATHPRLAQAYRSAAISAAKLSRKTEAKAYTLRAEKIEQGQVAYHRHTVDVSAFTSGK